MRTNTRSLPAAAAFFLLFSSAVTMPGCPKPEGPSNVAQPQVMAVVTYKTGAAAAQMTTSQSLPDPKKVQLNEYAGDTVWWFSPAGKIHIDPASWKPKRPFANDPAYEDGILKSGPPSEGTHGHTYEYTVVLVLPDGTTVQIDPHIGIMP